MTLSTLFKFIIRKFGMDIKIKKRIETVDSEGRVTFTFKDPIDSKAWIVPAGAIREDWFIVGYSQPIDYLGIFKADEDIGIGTIIILDDDSQVEVREIFIRKYGTSTEYKDVVLVKI